MKTKPHQIGEYIDFVELPSSTTIKVAKNPPMSPKRPVNAALWSYEARTPKRANKTVLKAVFVVSVAVCFALLMWISYWLGMVVGCWIVYSLVGDILRIKKR